MHADLDRSIAKARATASRLKGTERSRLSAIVTQECSLVDRPANLRVFSIIKRDAYASTIERAAAARDVLAKRLGHDRTARVLKASASVRGELRYVLGVVLAPEVFDAQNDIVSVDEIRKTAWDWLRHFRNLGLQHKGLINGKVHVVESFLAPVDIQIGGETITRGTWMIGVHVDDDELWADVKSGKLTGFSMGGFARKEPA